MHDMSTEYIFLGGGSVIFMNLRLHSSSASRMRGAVRCAFLCSSESFNAASVFFMTCSLYLSFKKGSRNWEMKFNELRESRYYLPIEFMLLSAKEIGKNT